MKKYKFTIYAALILTLIQILFISMGIELFEFVIETLEKFEKLEIDEFIIPAIIILIFFMFDKIRNTQLQRNELEKINIYTAMLKSTHHILNNFINQMQIFKLEAQEHPNFDKEVLELYDTIIEDAKTQINALENVSDINSKSIEDAVLPK